MTMDRLWYGGDYNPEQWPSAVWDDDVRLMQRAGVTVATVGVFSWALLEPEDGRFDFAWLDDVLDRLHAGGIRVDLATATASPPPWLVAEHSDIRPVTADGVPLGIGSRQSYSPSSATYRRYADRLVRALAERYGAHPALEAWHVNNELACHVRHDYSEESGAAFRAWLEAKYGSIEELNRAWGTAFWSQHYGSFAQVQPPRAMPTFVNPTQALDWDRFSSDAWLGVYRAEAAILREVPPTCRSRPTSWGSSPVRTTGAGPRRWTSSPTTTYVDPADPAAAAYAAMSRDLMRSLAGGAPWILMEQSTSAVNWRAHNAAKPAGMHRALTLQAVARGADGIMQFQWRQSAAGAEKFHSGMLPHAGGGHARLPRDRGARRGAGGPWPTSSARAWTPGRDPLRLGQLVGPRAARRPRRASTTCARSSAGTGSCGAAGSWSTSRGREPRSTATRSWSSRRRWCSRRPPDRSWRGSPTRADGLLVTYQSAILDEELHVELGGYLGELRETLGIWIEEFAPPAEPSLSGGPVPSLRIDGLAAGEARQWGEVVRVVDAEVLARFVGGMLDGMPAITRHAVGGGTAWYVATEPDDLAAVLGAVLEGTDVAPATPPPADVEILERGGRRFVLNPRGDAGRRRRGDGGGARRDRLLSAAPTRRSGSSSPSCFEMLGGWMP